MPFCNFVFLFHSSHELIVKNQKRCVPLGSHASHRAEQEVSRVVEFHSTCNHYFYIYNLFYNDFKGSIPFFTNILNLINTDPSITSTQIREKLFEKFEDIKISV